MTTSRSFGALVAGCIMLVGACTPIYDNHGYIPPPEDLQELVVGVDTRATVEEKVGVPSTSGMLSGGDYYYVRSRTKTVGARRPEVIERQVLAISFAPNDTLANIERFSLSDGIVVPLYRRVTDSSVDDIGLLQQLLSNIGAVNADDIFN
ncbi:MAG: outer membrane protein assembly factor BamE [Pseudomonadota bacterium]